MSNTVEERLCAMLESMENLSWLENDGDERDDVILRQTIGL